MILPIDKELIQMAFESENFFEIEVEQEFEGHEVFRRFQKIFDNILKSNNALKNYMSTNSYVEFESSGYGLVFKGGMFKLIMDFTLFSDGDEYKDMQLLIDFDLNLIVDKYKISKGFMSRDYIYNM